MLNLVPHGYGPVKPDRSPQVRHIPFPGVYRSQMVPSIGNKRARRLYLAEWMEHRGLDDERLAGRIGVERETVNRWRNYPARLSLPRIEEIAQALDCEPADLWRHPKQPSADALLRGAPDELQAKAVEMIGILLRTGT